MFDLISGLGEVVEGGVKDEVEIVGSWLLSRAFWDLGLCNKYGNVDPWFYPCLGLFCKV
jgi:hypothetical protein